jgi:pimeloyl-ACP methyl ester carboxylesterase
MILVLALLVGALLLFPLLAPGSVLRLALRFERRRAGLLAAVAAIDGHEMPYLVGGSGEPLILLHGFGADKDNWTRSARYLTPHFRVVAPDLPPFGECDSWGERASYSVAAQVERVRALARHLGFERFHLGGNSMGGAIAGSYAVTHPEDLLSLWLVAPAGVESEASELEVLLEEGKNPLLVSSPEEFRALLNFAMEKPPYIPRPVIKHLSALAVERRGRYQAVFEELTREREGVAPLDKALAGSEVPTLICWGARDRLLHVSGAEALGAVIQDAEIQVLPGVGHVPMVEQPGDSTAALIAFLGRRDP